MSHLQRPPTKIFIINTFLGQYLLQNPKKLGGENKLQGNAVGLNFKKCSKLDDGVITLEEIDEVCKGCYMYCFPKLTYCFDKLLENLKDIREHLA